MFYNVLRFFRKKTEKKRNKNGTRIKQKRNKNGKKAGIKMQKVEEIKKEVTEKTNKKNLFSKENQPKKKRRKTKKRSKQESINRSNHHPRVERVGNGKVKNSIEQRRTIRNKNGI